MTAQQSTRAGRSFDQDYFASDSYDTYLKEHVAMSIEEIVDPLFAVIGPEQNWTFLDVGCAMGGVLIALRDRGFSCRGVDISEFCLEHSPVKELMQYAPSTDLPFDDRSFDVVLMSDFFQYLTKEEALQTIAEASRVAKRYVGLWVFDGPGSSGWSQALNPDELRLEGTKEFTKEDYVNAFAKHSMTLHTFEHVKPEDYGTDFTPYWNFIFAKQ